MAQMAWRGLGQGDVPADSGGTQCVERTALRCWQKAWTKTKAGQILGDIFSQKPGEERPREAGLSYASFLENIVEGLAIFRAVNNGEAFILVDLNRAGEPLDETVKRRLIGKNVTDIIPEAKQSGLFDVLQKCWRTGESRRHPLTSGMSNGIEISMTAAVYRMPSDQLAVVFSDQIRPKQLEESLPMRGQELLKRLKELNCVLSISELVETSSVSLQEVLQGIVDLIPLASRCPEVTHARLVLGFQDFRSRDYEEGVSKEASQLTVYGEHIGKLELHGSEKRPDGSEGPFLEEGRSVLDAIAKRVVHVIQRGLVKKALRGEQETIEALLNSTGDPAAMLDTEGTILLANPVLVLEFGKQVDQMLGRPIYDFVPPYLASTARARIDEAIQTGKTLRFQDEIQDGRRFESIFLPVFDVEAKVRSVALLIHNVTETIQATESARQTEETYRVLVDNAPYGTISVTRDGRILDVNRRVLEILGAPSVEAVRSTNVLTSPPLAGVDVSQAFRHCLEKGQVTNVESPVTTQWGKNSYWRILLTPVLDLSGEVCGCQGILEDITARKKAEDLLVQTERIRALGEMAGGVAHNFNNLLQVILSASIEVLADLETGNLSETPSIVRTILKTAGTGTEMIRRLQTFSRIRTGEAIPSGEVFDLSSTVAKSIEMTKCYWKTGAEVEGIKIGMNPYLTHGCTIRGKENELFEVMVNLIKNAVEALPRGGEITISTSVDGDHTYVQIHDNGVGIPAQNVGKVFEPFWTSKGLMGTGMGLSSSYGIIRRHGGEISLDTKEAEGTTFTIRLPLSDYTPAPEGTPPLDTPPVQCRILLIDDEADILALIGRTLRRHSHTVVTASSGREGIELFKKSGFDLVICDLAMAGMSGFEVGEEIKEICREKGVTKPPLILLTGWASQLEEEDQIATSGFDLVVNKPVRFQKLLKGIKDLMKADSAE